MATALSLDTILDEVVRHREATGEWIPSARKYCHLFCHGTHAVRRHGPWEDILAQAKRRYALMQDIRESAPPPDNRKVHKSSTKPSPPKSSKSVPKLTPNPQPEWDLDEWMESIRERVSLQERSDPRISHAILGSPEATDPIALVCTSDWHFGSRYVDYEKWEQDFRYFQTLPPDRFRILLMGDLIDNVYPQFRNADVVFGALTPREQRNLLREILRRLEKHLELACWGNHDNEWDEKRNADSPVAELLRSFCHYFWATASVEYWVGSQSYRLFLSHDLKGRSWFHSLHGNIRGFLDTHADIVIGAHTHTPAFMMDYYGLTPEGTPKPRCLVRLGTYKTGPDTYSARYFRPGVIGNITLVLYPDTHKIVPFDNVNDAARYLGI